MTAPGTLTAFRCNPRRSRQLERLLLIPAVVIVIMPLCFAFQYELLGKLSANPLLIAMLVLTPALAI
ncbi:MAG: hypothetical protein ACREUF_16550, partial [Solimonas sp.]